MAAAGCALVRAPGELAEAVASAQREAAAAFGSDEVFLERYLSAPRHVEVQIVGDTHGSVLHLYDRECSVQRRHQKVVEEAPAVFVPLETRHQMWEAAVAAAKAVAYVGVGTVEYLVDAGGFYFLEMNTRLQVEHGVTELVTGLDLVGLQLAVAAGRPLPFGQDDVDVTGHAVEVRLCAERPREDYRPTPGTVTHVRWPEGPGLRTDRGIETASVVSPAYDSLVAKLMAHGEDRVAAVGRLSLALRALELDGLETNRALLGAVLDDAAFVGGEVDVHFLERRPDLRDAVAVRRGAPTARRRGGLLPPRGAGGRQRGPRAGGGLAQRRAAPPRGRADGRRRDDGGSCRRAGRARPGARRRCVARGGHRNRRRRRGRPHGARRAAPTPPGAAFGALGPGERARGPVDVRPAHRGRSRPRGGVAGECRAPLPGAITKVLASVGDPVAEGDGLVVLEAMKMEHTLRANGAGTVAALHCLPGQQVDVNDLLVVVEPA